MGALVLAIFGTASFLMASKTDAVMEKKGSDALPFLAF